MFKKEGRSESGTTLVAGNCELVGDVHFSDELLVNGIVKGNIYAKTESKAVVRISEKGRVQGEIRVPRVIVNGEVFGDIWSDKHIELAAKAEVKGNVYYNLIEMVQGSRIDGQLVHLQDGKHEHEVAESKPAKAAKAAEKADEDTAALVTAVKNQTA
jgi:cytoskeletal protein CcmA (bactofilin family)